MNGKLIQNHDATTVISFYEFIAGVFYLSYFLYNKFTADFFCFALITGLMLILASICTAYAFTASVKVMKN
jgi:hypothetical protein